MSNVAEFKRNVNYYEVSVLKNGEEVFRTENVQSFGMHEGAGGWLTFINKREDEYSKEDPMKNPSDIEIVFVPPTVDSVRVTGR